MAEMTPHPADAAATAAGRHRKPSRRVGPMGYSGASTIVAGITVCGAVTFAGWGLTHMATTADAAVTHDPASVVTVTVTMPPTPGSDKDGTVTVTLPDRNHNGVPDVLEDHDKGGDPSKQPSLTVYVVQPGDTLTAISAATGVPIDILTELNQIADANVIYAGAVLLIPVSR